MIPRIWNWLFPRCEHEWKEIGVYWAAGASESKCKKCGEVKVEKLK